MGVSLGFMIRFDTIHITPEILSLIAGIDEFKGVWRALGILAPDRLSVLHRAAIIESIGASTRMGGSKLSDREVERLLSHPQTSSFANSDEQQVASCAAVMKLVFVSWRDIALTENHIRQLHRNLLRYSEQDAWHRGCYKTSANSAAAFEMPRQMAELVAWFQRERDAGCWHPLLLIGLFIVALLEIHPFEEGNGRLSHVLTTLLLLQAGYAYVPYGALERVIEQDKEAYCLALRQTQDTMRSEISDWQPWLVFFLRSMAEQVRRLNERIEHEKQALATLPALSLRIVEFTREYGRITIGEAVKLTGASRNTLKLHFRALAENSYLQRQGNGRGVWYNLK